MDLVLILWTEIGLISFQCFVKTNQNGCWISVVYVTAVADTDDSFKLGVFFFKN